MKILEEKLKLKELVDVFSNLADVKDTNTQAQLFTEDAVLTSYNGDQVFEQRGRNAIEEACANFLELFDTVYHINGQQVVDIQGDKATGVSYCQVVLIGPNEKGERVQNMQGVRYEDEYLKVDGEWKIANRTSHFVWSDSKNIG